MNISLNKSFASEKHQESLPQCKFRFRAKPLSKRKKKKMLRRLKKRIEDDVQSIIGSNLEPTTKLSTQIFDDALGSDESGKSSSWGPGQSRFCVGSS